MYINLNNKKGGKFMILKLILFLLIAFDSYLIIQKIIDANLLKRVNKYLNEKNEKYYEELLKYYDKNKKIKLKSKINVFHKINIKLDTASIKRNLLINPITLICLSFVCFTVVYLFVFNFFKIITLSLIVSIPFVLIPFAVIDFIGNYKAEKIEKIFPNFLLQLKNYTRINNDIIYAMQEVQTIEPLQSYVNTFLIEINSGIKFEKAIQNLKEKIDIEIFRNFFSNLEHCYLYGGSFTDLIDKSYKMINEIQKEKDARIQETKSARLVLFILIFLNLFVYMSNIKNNPENYMIMQKTFIGNVILYWNFISIWLLVLLANKVKKLDY